MISTYAKSGTTWTQQIVAQLLFGHAQVFIYKWTNGRRTETLKSEDAIMYESRALQEHGAEAARWRATVEGL